ncbi:MAG: glycosyltransferase family 39 protein [Bacteroidetes bacterium]|nr:glycosyltransferase family 39 protein [Bacteroidota bacterium]
MLTDINNISLDRKDKRNIALILAAALIIKLILAFTLSADLRSDSLDYHKLAISMVKAGEYSLDGKPTASSTIGYPLFIAGVYALAGADQLSVRIAQSILEIFTGIMFFIFCLKYFDIKKSIIALAVFSFFPSNILYSQTLLSEALFGLLALVILYYFYGGKIDGKIFFIGMITGYAFLVRTSFMFSILVFPLALFVYNRNYFEGYKSKRIKRAVQYTVYFFAGAAIVVLPWLIRNKIVLNTFSTGTHGGSTFWSGSNPDATGTWYHKIEDTNPIFNIQDEAERDKAFYKAGMDYAIKNPHKFAVLGVKKLVYFFSSERMALLYFTPGEGRARTSTEVYKSINPFIIALVNIPYFAVMILGTWGLMLMKKRRFILYGYIFTCLFTFFIFVALARYHYVLIPLFVMGAVKFAFENRFRFSHFSMKQKIFGILVNLFFLVIWFAEFYLIYK